MAGGMKTQQRHAGGCGGSSTRCLLPPHWQRWQVWLTARRRWQRQPAWKTGTAQPTRWLQKQLPPRWVCLTSHALQCTALCMVGAHPRRRQQAALPCPLHRRRHTSTPRRTAAPFLTPCVALCCRLLPPVRPPPPLPLLRDTRILLLAVHDCRPNTWLTAEHKQMTAAWHRQRCHHCHRHHQRCRHHRQRHRRRHQQRHRRDRCRQQQQRQQVQQVLEVQVLWCRLYTSVPVSRRLLLVS